MTVPIRGGTVLSGVLGIVFVALKLYGVLELNWWWVAAPFMVPIVVLDAIMIPVCLTAIIRRLDVRISYTRKMTPDEQRIVAMRNEGADALQRGLIRAATELAEQRRHHRPRKTRH